MPYIPYEEYDASELNPRVTLAYGNRLKRCVDEEGVADVDLIAWWALAIDAAIEEAVAADEVTRLVASPVPENVVTAFGKRFSICAALTNGPGAAAHCHKQALMEAFNVAEELGVIKDVREEGGHPTQ